MKHLPILVLITCLSTPAAAQSLDVGGAPGAQPQPINITAKQGIEWQQNQQQVIATGDAQAVRGAVTVDADTLIAHYRKKAASAVPGKPAMAAPPAVTNQKDASSASDILDQGDTEIYELDAIGNVHIFTATDNAYGDKAVYNVDAGALVLTGKALKLTTPHDVITARDDIEYYSVKRMAVARGDALIKADDGRSIQADTLVGYLLQSTPVAAAAAQAKTANSDSLNQAGKLREVDAFGHVLIHTTTDTVTGDRGIYLPQEQKARLGGNVHIIRGKDQLTGSDALVNMKTGVSTLLAGPNGQVAGIIVPNSAEPSAQSPPK